jgi:hypothetical protein
MSAKDSPQGKRLLPRAAAAKGEDLALKRGADELMDRCEWALRRQPRALKLARKHYVDLCYYLHRAIVRAYRRHDPV